MFSHQTPSRVSLWFKERWDPVADSEFSSGLWHSSWGNSMGMWPIKTWSVLYRRFSSGNNQTITKSWTEQKSAVLMFSSWWLVIVSWMLILFITQCSHCHNHVYYSGKNSAQIPSGQLASNITHFFIRWEVHKKWFILPLQALNMVNQTVHIQSTISLLTAH